MVEKNTKKGRVRVIESVDSESVTSNNSRKNVQELKLHIESIFDYIIQKGYGCEFPGATYDSVSFFEDGVLDLGKKPNNLIEAKKLVIFNINRTIKRRCFIVCSYDSVQPDLVGNLYIRPFDAINDDIQKVDRLGILNADKLGCINIDRLDNIDPYKYWFLEVLGSENVSGLTRFAEELSDQYKVDIDVFKSTDESKKCEPYYGPSSASSIGYD